MLFMKLCAFQKNALEKKQKHETSGTNNRSRQNWVHYRIENLYESHHDGNLTSCSNSKESY